jgi:type IV pilus assembly protein PilQ
MNRTVIIKGLGLTAALTFAASALAASGGGQVSKIELQPGKQRATLLITHTGQGHFRLFKSEKQGTVIIEAEDLVIPPSLTKMLDASSSEGPVSQMTPYNSQHSGHAMAKLVLQLRGGADVSSTDLPGKFLVDFVKKAGPMPAASARANTAKGPGGTKNWTERDELKGRNAAPAKGDEVARKLIEVLSAPQEEKKYFGSRVTFEAKDAEVPDIFRLVGESSELNIVWDPEVEGQKTSLAVKDLPWDQLLDIVIQQKNYKAVVMGSVVRIMTIDTFNRQAEAKKKEITLSDELEPVIMSVIPLGYTQAADMKKLISELIQERTQASGAAGGPVAGGKSDSTTLTQDFKRGRIEVDERTNSLVVTNTKDSIDRMRRLVKELDVPVPQVLIDAKIIIASEQFAKNVGVSWSSGLFSTSGIAGINGGVNGVTPPQFKPPSATDGSAGAAAAAGTPFAVSAPAGGAALGLSFGTTSAANIQAALTLSEIDNLTKTVASPRVIVNNNKQASISDGTTIVITPAPTALGAAAQPTTVNATLGLSVTPQVTSAGSVQMKSLTITKNDLGAITGTQVNTTTKTLTTDVLVDSGATLVLGGVYQLAKATSEQGVPLLKDLPFIGQLFRANSQTDSKEELMVFITPQIIDPQSSSQTL